MAEYIIVDGKLCHHGIKGMKWGVRRFQTKSGDLTPAGKKRYITTRQGMKNANDAAKEARKKSLAESRATDSGIGSYRRAMNKASAAGKEAYRKSIAKDKAYNKQLREEKKAESEHKGLSDKQKKALKVGAAVAGTALAAYGAKKFHDYIRDENGKLAVEAGRKAMQEASNTTGVKGLYQLADQHNAAGRYARAMELERKAADIAVNYGLKTQSDMEKLNFAKAAANVYLNKKRR